MASRSHIRDRRSGRSRSRDGLRLLLGVALLLGLAAPAWTARPDASPLDPSARRLSGGDAVEQWDLVAQLDSGHRIVGRFMITDVGPGRRNGVAIGYLLLPDGRRKEFRNGRLARGWSLSEDGRDLRMGNSRLILADGSPADPSRFRMAITKDHIEIDLPFEARAQARLPRPALPEGVKSQLLALGAPTRARFFVPGMMEAPAESAGRVTMSQTWVKDSESERIPHRIEVMGFHPDSASYLSESMTPEGKRLAWLAHTDGGGEGWSGEIPSSDLGPVRTLNRGEGFWLPDRADWESDSAVATLDVGEILVEVDPLTVLPSPVRWLVSLTLQPYRVWADGDFRVTLPADSESPLDNAGPSVVVVTFLNPGSVPQEAR